MVYRMVAFRAWRFRWLRLWSWRAIWFRVCNTCINRNSYTKLRFQVVQTISWISSQKYNTQIYTCFVYVFFFFSILANHFDVSTFITQSNFFCFLFCFHFYLSLPPTLSLSISISFSIPSFAAIFFSFLASIFRCTSLNVIRDPYSTNRPGLVSIIPDVSPTPARPPLAPLSQLQENAFPG